MISTSEVGPYVGRWVPRLRLDLQHCTDVVGMGPAVWQGGFCQLVWLLTDVVVVIAHPLLAAATLRPGQPGPGAAPVGQGDLVRTERHAAHHSIDTGALVLAVGPEVLAVLVHLAVELTGQTVSLSCQHARGKQETELSGHRQGTYKSSSTVGSNRERFFSTVNIFSHF